MFSKRNSIIFNFLLFPLICIVIVNGFTELQVINSEIITEECYGKPKLWEDTRRYRSCINKVIPEIYELFNLTAVKVNIEEICKRSDDLNECTKTFMATLRPCFSVEHEHALDIFETLNEDFLNYICLKTDDMRQQILTNMSECIYGPEFLIKKCLNEEKRANENFQYTTMYQQEQIVKACLCNELHQIEFCINNMNESELTRIMSPGLLYLRQALALGTNSRTCNESPTTILPKCFIFGIVIVNLFNYLRKYLNMKMFA